MPETIFGISGAGVVQFFVILVFVLIVTGVGYWLFQRYYSTGLITGSRSRIPRLGVIDNLSIDHQHRLVLIRRDNVEHLLLIGKTADIVVESSIVRTASSGARARQGQAPRQQPQHPARHPQQQTTATAAPKATGAPSAAPNRSATSANPPPRQQSTGISEPIPFPQGRRAQTLASARAAGAEPSEELEFRDQSSDENARQDDRSTRQASPTVAPLPAIVPSGGATASASAHFVEPAHPTRVEPAFSLADALDEIADGPTADRLQPVVDATASADEAAPPDSAESEAVGLDMGRLEANGPAAENASRTVGDGDVERSADRAAESEVADQDRDAKVSNLEQEMARLLGEITAKRNA